MATGPRFLIVEDYPATARGLARTFRNHGDVTIAGTLAEARQHLTDGVLWTGLCLDVELPDGNGLDLLAELRESRPWFPVMVLTGVRDERFVNRVQALNAYFALKPPQPAGLQAFAELAISSQQPPSSLELAFAQAAVEWGLTPGEARVLDLALEGLTVDEIAERLERSRHTVVAHSRSLRAKAGHKGSLMDVVRELLGRARTTAP